MGGASDALMELDASLSATLGDDSKSVSITVPSTKNLVSRESCKQAQVG